MNYDEWLKAVPEEITADSLWKMNAYRIALFLTDLGWQDVTKLARDHRLIGLSDQLYRSLGSVSANLAEGYSRGTGPDRARFYEYSLGSARESRDWYYKSRHVLGEEVVRHRMQLLADIIRLLLTMMPQQRGRLLRDDSFPYEINASAFDGDLNLADLTDLLDHVPLSET